MGFILQTQRRAIEKLFSPEFKVELKVRRKQRYYLEGKEIFLLGISRGVGSCSDYHDINFAVFGKKGSSKFPSLDTIECAGGVLLREPHKEESKKWKDDAAILVVEKLRVLSEEDAVICFTKTEKQTSYVPL